MTRTRVGSSVKCRVEGLLPCVERRGSGAFRRQRSEAALCSTNGTGRGTNMIRRCAWLYSFLLSVLLPLPSPLLLWFLLLVLLLWYMDGFVRRLYCAFLLLVLCLCVIVTSVRSRWCSALVCGLSLRRANRKLDRKSIEQLVIYATE
ncbi:uncharacterized, partial [Tachysurus ichikawai]